jgi:hypothetical protein
MEERVKFFINIMDSSNDILKLSVNKEGFILIEQDNFITTLIFDERKKEFKDTKLEYDMCAKESIYPIFIPILNYINADSTKVYTINNYIIYKVTNDTIIIERFDVSTNKYRVYPEISYTIFMNKVNNKLKGLLYHNIQIINNKSYDRLKLINTSLFICNNEDDKVELYIKTIQEKKYSFKLDKAIFLDENEELFNKITNTINDIIK